MNKSLGWLVVGVGDITTKRVIPAILAEPRSRLAGIVTRSPEKAQAYGVPAWTSLDRALAESGAGAVYVASPAGGISAPHDVEHLQCIHIGLQRTRTDSGSSRLPANWPASSAAPRNESCNLGTPTGRVHSTIRMVEFFYSQETPHDASRR